MVYIRPYIREIINRLKFEFLSGNSASSETKSLQRTKREKEREKEEKIVEKKCFNSPSFVSSKLSGLFYQLFRAFPSILLASCHASVSSIPDTERERVSFLSFVEATSLIGLTQKYSGGGEMTKGMNLHLLVAYE